MESTGVERVGRGLQAHGSWFEPLGEARREHVNVEEEEHWRCRHPRWRRWFRAGSMGETESTSVVRVDQDLDAQVVGSSNLARSGVSMSRGRGWARRCACWCLGEEVVLGAVCCCVSLGWMCGDVVFLCISARVGVGERVRAGVLCLRVVVEARESETFAPTFSDADLSLWVSLCSIPLVPPLCLSLSSCPPESTAHGSQLSLFRNASLDSRHP